MNEESKKKTVLVAVLGALALLGKVADSGGIGCARKMARVGGEAEVGAGIAYRAAKGVETAHAADVALAGADLGRAADLAGESVRAVDAGGDVARQAPRRSAAARRGAAIQSAIRWADVAGNVSTGADVIEELSEFLEEYDPGAEAVSEGIADSPSTVLCVVEPTGGACDIVVIASGSKPVRVSLTDEELEGSEALAELLAVNLRRGDAALADAWEAAETVVLVASSAAPDVQPASSGASVIRIEPPR